ncbi:MAG TPA: S8 family serine peptidase, partial [Pedobacter sp.]
MNKLLPAFLLLCFALSSSAQTNFYGRSRTFKLPASISPADYLPNTIIVKFKESTASSSTARVLSVQPVITLKTASILSLNRKFSESSGINKNQGTVSKEADKIGLSRVYELKYSGNAGIEEVVNELLSNKNVEYAEPAYVAHISYEPNDPLYASSQTYLAQVKAPEAWNLIRNSSGVIIGIVDSGSELTHEDLQSNIIGGWDLIGASASNFAEDSDPNVVSSENDHGVHVSGLASAVTDNAKGVASIASDAKLFIVKVAADDDREDIFNGFDGIKYAVDHGANIINCSWGSTARSFYGEDIVNYAINKGCLIVAAGGNNAWSTPDYPAGYKGVIAVA